MSFTAKTVDAYGIKHYATKATGWLSTACELKEYAYMIPGLCLVRDPSEAVTCIACIVASRDD